MESAIYPLVPAKAETQQAEKARWIPAYGAPRRVTRRGPRAGMSGTCS